MARGRALLADKTVGIRATAQSEEKPPPGAQKYLEIHACTFGTFKEQQQVSLSPGSQDETPVKPESHFISKGAGSRAHKPPVQLLNIGLSMRPPCNSRVWAGPSAAEVTFTRGKVEESHSGLGNQSESALESRSGSELAAGPRSFSFLSSRGVSACVILCRHHADLREDPHGQDHHP